MRSTAWYILCIFAALVVIHTTHAQVMTSSNYHIESDSINFGGGFSSSTNYIQESTFGEIGTGRSNSASYQLRAGYQQMQEVYLSLATDGDVTMSPSIPGVSGGTGNGSTTITAISDSPAGYTLQIEFSSSPAMTSGGNSIADYTIGATADYDFTVTDGEAYFGFSPSGDDVIDRYKDSASTCGSGSVTDQQCWDGPSTTARTIAQSALSNQPDGATTTIYFRVGVGAGAMQPPGAYVATTTVTLLPQ